MLDDPAADALQSILAALDYPMGIVTTTDGSQRAGCLVGFAAQCSIDPPLVMIWLSKRNHTTRVAREASALLVHFPSRSQRDLAALFGQETGDEVDKFARCRWQPGPDGLPLLSDCSRWMAGRIVERLDTGDHVGHLLDPFDAATGGWSGQLGFQSVKDLEPGHRA
ncbi:MAG: flavin reductase family protein [Actinomycetota bacterium]|nr:flavin reductase family protein [Actinomycetota bacterium]